MKVRENLEIIIATHAFAESLNKRLLEDVKKLEVYKNPLHKTNIYAQKYAVKPDEVTASIRTIKDWVASLLVIEYPVIMGVEEECEGDFNIGVWFAKYGIGDHTISHCHHPYGVYGFVYFVNSPKGSSPLVFTTSGKRIKAEAGKVVIFPGSLLHHVPKNNGDGRVILAGNLAIRRNESTRLH